MEIVKSSIIHENSLRGSITPPPDKSIAQRSAILSSIADGKSIIYNFSKAQDPQSTLQAIKDLGIGIEESPEGEKLIVHGGKPKEAEKVLDLENSGTGFRLLLGLLAGCPDLGHVCLTGDQSLRRRPMRRIVSPLKELGASIDGRAGGDLAPLSLRGQSLRGGEIQMSVGSAQLKSALLLSSLHAQSPLTIIQKHLSRNHTEVMLKDLGADLQYLDSHTLRLSPGSLFAKEITIPGDISGAAFWIVGACIVSGSQITIEGVGLNPSRTGILQCLKEMGAQIETEITHQQAESIGNIHISHGDSPLQAVEIAGEIIPNIIDELPILALAAARAKGKTIIRDASELRVKESDRIKSICQLLSEIGAQVEERADGLIIEGNSGRPFSPREHHLKPGHDHRLIMTAAIASLLCDRDMTIHETEWASVSYPGFFDDLERLCAG